MPLLQSAYWPGRSTETALVKVISDVIDAADEKNVTLFGLLDMCGAFDTVDFQILLHRLKVSYGLEWTVRYYSGFCQTELILSRSLVVVPLLPNWTVEYPRAQYLAP